MNENPDVKKRITNDFILYNDGNPANSWKLLLPTGQESTDAERSTSGAADRDSQADANINIVNDTLQSLSRTTETVTFGELGPKLTSNAPLTAELFNEIRAYINSELSTEFGDLLSRAERLATQGTAAEPASPVRQRELRQIVTQLEQIIHGNLAQVDDYLGEVLSGELTKAADVKTAHIKELRGVIEAKTVALGRVQNRLGAAELREGWQAVNTDHEIDQKLDQIDTLNRELARYGIYLNVTDASTAEQIAATADLGTQLKSLIESEPFFRELVTDAQTRVREQMGTSNDRIVVEVVSPNQMARDGMAGAQASAFAQSNAVNSLLTNAELASRAAKGYPDDAGAFVKLNIDRAFNDGDVAGLIALISNEFHDLKYAAKPHTATPQNQAIHAAIDDAYRQVFTLIGQNLPTTAQDRLANRGLGERYQTYRDSYRQSQLNKIGAPTLAQMINVTYGRLMSTYQTMNGNATLNEAQAKQIIGAELQPKLDALLGTTAINDQRVMLDYVDGQFKAVVVKV